MCEWSDNQLLSTILQILTGAPLITKESILMNSIVYRKGDDYGIIFMVIDLVVKGLINWELYHVMFQSHIAV